MSTSSEDRLCGCPPRMCVRHNDLHQCFHCTGRGHAYVCPEPGHKCKVCGGVRMAKRSTAA